MFGLIYEMKTYMENKYEFNKKYKKSIEEGYDDYTLIDYGVVKPKKEDYPDWETGFQANCNYIREKFRYTYGSKEKKKA